jgi:hypothetical protein
VELSQLKIYSIGTVAANKLLSSKEIMVVPIEDSPLLDGELTDTVSIYKANAQDSTGVAYSVELNTSAAVKATWLPLGSSNRLTAPDVRRGEMVALYRFSDVDGFWWTTLKDDMHLRKLETVIYAFSATIDEDATPSSENTYFFEISTHNKLVHFHTSKANGEPYAYDIQINTKEGIIQIQDDAGQVFMLNSKERQLEMINADKSKIEINKTNIFIQSTDLIEMKSKVIRQESIDNNMMATNVTQDATSSELKASTLDITAITTHTGNIQLNGNITSAAGGGGSGDASFAGNVGAKDANISGTVTANKVVSSEPVVAPNV